MKHLFIALIFIPFQAWSADEVKELSVKELSRKAVSVIRDVEIDKHLSEVPVFQKCRDDQKYKFKAGESKADVDQKLNAAVACFKKEIGNDDKKLKEIAEKLNLQSYGLIQSKNSKDISEYLANKMYKAMTGVDRKSADIAATIEAMKFKNKKMLDQKDFIDMYTTQLGKSALYEISRFCFEDFRIKNNSAQDFASHWDDFFKKNIELQSDDLDDIGNGSFFEVKAKDKDGIYKEISDKISSGQIKTDRLSAFFNYCGQNILPLCVRFELANSSKAATSTSTTTSTPTTMSSGARACLTKAKLQEYRKALAQTEKVAAEFDKMSGPDAGFALEGVKFYDRGKSNEKESIDNLTNYSATDLLEGGLDQNAKLDDLIAHCKTNSKDEKCKDYIVIDDSLEKAAFSLNMDMKLKKEIQLARVREAIKAKNKSLEEYLETEGYLDLLENYKKNPDPAILEKGIDDIFEAKRVASLEAIKLKLGKRQISEADSKIGNTVKDNIEKNIEEVRDERARLAQVVLFNNIITSHLELVKGKGANKVSLGKNRNAWLAEENARGNSKTDPTLFSQLKTEAKKGGPGPNSSENSIVGLQMLDTILGKPPE